MNLANRTDEIQRRYLQKLWAKGVKLSKVEKLAIGENLGEKFKVKHWWTPVLSGIRYVIIKIKFLTLTSDIVTSVLFCQH